MAQRRTVVADYTTRQPLPNASVFDRKGVFTGICDAKGRIPNCGTDSYPLTVRYLGYSEETVASAAVDTVFLRVHDMELPEVVVESKKHSILHLMAYVREYSTLYTLTDTVTLFREKMVDFMKPVVKTRFKGWTTPRVLNVRSYYRFTNAEGLDSVADRCSYHFSWTDWVGLPPEGRLPQSLRGNSTGTDTVFGRYSFTELWHKNNDRIILDLDILADTTSRKWVPNLSLFFRKDIDFERFNAKFNFENVFDTSLDETNITGYSYNIESKGRGRGMFMFNRYDEAFYVTTYCEVYIIDKEYITEKEARKWEKNINSQENLAFFIPSEAPELHPSVVNLIARVNSIDYDLTRLASTPDLKNVGYRAERLNPGQRILNRVKSLFGIDYVRAKRKWNKNYNEFRRNQQSRNNTPASS